MRKLYFLLFILVSFVTFSCKSKSTFTDYSQSTKLENALLWKIEGNNVSEPSYLYGTIHLIPKDDFFLPNGTEEAIKNTDQIVFEIDMNEMQDPSLAMTLMSKILMQDNKTLKDVMTEEDYNLVKQDFESKGLPFFMFERMKPMFLSYMTNSDVINGSSTSYELELLNMGKSLNKEFGGLETIEYQLNIFDQIPYEDQANMLIQGIKSAEEKNVELLDQLVTVYKDQDLEKLGIMINDDKLGVGKYEDLLLNDRNHNWIPIIEKQIKTKPTFYAVGAGHLPGVEGVIKLLRKSGYKVSPVSHKK